MAEKTKSKASEKLKKAFRSFVFDGVLLIVLGVVMLIRPEDSLKIICIILGSVLCFIGLIKCVVYFTKKDDAEQNAADLLAGIVQIGIGVPLIVASGFFITVFQYVTGVILAFGAILMFYQAFLLRKEKGPMFTASLIFAVITAALAVVILINPSAFASFMVQLHGGALIIEGIAMISVLHRIGVPGMEKKEEKKKD